VPGDGLAFAVGVGGEVDLAGAFDAASELLDGLDLVARHEVGGREVVADLDASLSEG
jgi:hypothetical protein